MTVTGTTADLLAFVREVCDALAPACQKVKVAGSVRRGKADPHDIELVLLPIRDTDLFGSEQETYSALDATLEELVRGGRLAWDTEVKRNGPRLKRFTMPSLGGMPFELYIADSMNFGAVHAIRTGSHMFSKLLMTSVKYGGCMPRDMRQQDGYLMRFPSEWSAKAGADGVVVTVPTERDYFAALRIPYVEPAQRTEEKARELALLAATGGVRA